MEKKTAKEMKVYEDRRSSVFPMARVMNRRYGLAAITTASLLLVINESEYMNIKNLVNNNSNKVEEVVDGLIKKYFIGVAPAILSQTEINELFKEVHN